MNILVVSQYYHPEPFRISDLCEALVKRGHLVTVVTGLPNYPDGKIYPEYKYSACEEKINGVRVIRCKNRPRKTGNMNLALNYLSFVFAANKTLKRLEEEYDIVYGYQLSPVTSMIPAKRYAKLKKIPFFIYCLDIWPASVESIFHSGSIAYNLIKNISQSVYKSANRIAVTSPCFKDYISALIGSSDNVYYLPQHCSDILSVIQNGTSIENRNKDSINFLFAGNIGSSQNLESVIRSLSKSADKTKIKLHIIGSGSSLNSVIEECNRLGLNDNVIFYGRLPKEDVAKYYEIADVCIVSLKNEGIVGNTIPGKLQEYMSAGKAILAYIDGDAARVINDANCGICVSAEDENSLCDSFSLFLDKEKNFIWGRNARLYYEDYFILEKHVDLLEKDLLTICKR